MKPQTRLNKIMKIEDECKRILALSNLCFKIIPQSQVWLDAIEEIHRLEKLGIKMICVDGKMEIWYDKRNWFEKESE